MATSNEQSEKTTIKNLKTSNDKSVTSDDHELTATIHTSGAPDGHQHSKFGVDQVEYVSEKSKEVTQFSSPV